MVDRLICTTNRPINHSNTNQCKRQTRGDFIFKVLLLSYTEKTGNEIRDTNLTIDVRHLRIKYRQVTYLFRIGVPRIDKYFYLIWEGPRTKFCWLKCLRCVFGGGVPYDRPSHPQSHNYPISDLLHTGVSTHSRRFRVLPPSEDLLYVSIRIFIFESYQISDYDDEWSRTWIWELTQKVGGVRSQRSRHYWLYFQDVPKLPDYLGENRFSDISKFKGWYCPVSGLRGANDVQGNGMSSNRLELVSDWTPPVFQFGLLKWMK